MKSFIAEIAIGTVVHEFYFVRTSASNPKQYAVTVADRTLNVHSFTMAFQNGQWMILDRCNVCEWIRKAGFNLQNAVLANEKK